MTTSPTGRPPEEHFDHEAAARALANVVAGEVRFGLHDRMLYATDASLYQVEPLGVVVPASIDDAVAAVRFCGDRMLPILPRGGGTSLAGQCTNRAVVLDFSAHCRAVRSVDAAGRRCRVEPGITIDDLNEALAPTGLFFAPDPATSKHCNVGGAIGNNAAGARSVRYGRTSESLLGVDVVLSTGQRATLDRGAITRDPIARELTERVAAVVRRHERLIRERYPKTVRRNAGYGLDMVLMAMDEAAARGADRAGQLENINLAHLLAGSEGTLAVTLGAELLLHPLPAGKGLATISFASVDDAIAAVPRILETGPSAVELLDDVVLGLASANAEYRRYVELMPRAGDVLPRAVLYVEYFVDALTPSPRSGAADREEGRGEWREQREQDNPTRNGGDANPPTARSGGEGLPVPAIHPRDVISAALTPKFDALRARFGSARVKCFTDAGAMLEAWKLRKAGEPLLHGMAGARKPITFVEDNAIPVERLGEFVRRLRELVARHGTTAAFYAHASVGVLHVRPLIDIHDEGDRGHMRAIALETARLARDLGGVMSGEHGDGRVRGPLLEEFYGPDLMRAFAEVKRIFDPRGLLNPGMIVPAAGRLSGPAALPLLHASKELSSSDARPDAHVEFAQVGSSDDGAARAEQLGSGLGEPAHLRAITTNLRVLPKARPIGVPNTDTYFDYHDQHGFDAAVEMCNGAGVCRKKQGGTMCPSYMATLDERHSTRGRGNALRLAITGQFEGRVGSESPARSLTDGKTPPAGADADTRWSDPDTIATLDLCLSCKACKTECPSNVDIARLKAEYTAQRYRAAGRTPLASQIMSAIRSLNRLGARTPRLANLVSGVGPVRRLIGRVMDVHPGRSIPGFCPSLEREFAERDRFLPPVQVGSHDDRPLVALFGDCFTLYNEGQIGRAARQVLEACGYRVLLPRHGCCARPAISLGLLADAIRTIDQTCLDLRPFIDDERVRAILFLEPSCLSAIKDDWLSLKMRTPVHVRKQLAAKSYLAEDFVDRMWDSHPTRPRFEQMRAGESVSGETTPALPGEIVLHAHCHQKALWGAETSARLLRRFPGSAVRVLDSGCCGMAGSFGYSTRRYDLSMRIGELTLLPAVRAAESATIAASGTSCRHQIKDGTGRRALHPIEVAAAHLPIAEQGGARR